MEKKKILEFNHPTKLDLNPDKILNEAVGKLKNVVVMGEDKDGYMHFSSSVADGGTVLWYMEKCKQILLRDDDE